MTSLSKAKLTLALVCILFFVLGSCSIFAISPLRRLAGWSSAPTMSADPDFAALLDLNTEQVAKQKSIYRAWDAQLKKIDDEIKRKYFPRIQELNKAFSDQLRDILTEEQRTQLDEYSTGKRKLPGHGKVERRSWRNR